MNSNATLFEPHLDNVFGPRVNGDSHTFDFTLLFEQSILTIGPSAFLLLVFPFRIAHLYRKDIKVLPGLLLVLKLAAIGIFACLQLTLLVLWSLPAAPRTRASIAAASLSLIDAFFIFILSYTEHTRSIRPSTVLNLYFSLSTLFDIAQTRTLWLRSGSQGISAIFTTSLALKITILVLEATEKRAMLTVTYQHSAPESTSGIFNRSVFWWLNSLFRRGFRALLAVEDLAEIDSKFSSRVLRDDLQHNWDSNKKTGKYMLFLATFSTFKWPFLAAIFPRLCFIGFSFAQPFLINRTIDFVGKPVTESTKSISYGIIGATVLIYVGLGVSRCHYKHKTYQVITMFRGALASLIFRKTTNLALGALDDSAAMTLMSTDIDSIANGLQNMHEIWANAIEVGLGIYLLERQVGIACVFVVIPAVVCTLSISRVARSMGPTRMIWNRAIQKRVAVTSSTLGQMKGIKIMGLTDCLSSAIQNQRVTELELSKQFRMLIVWANMIANLSDQITPVVVVAAAVFWSQANSAEELSVASAFTTLSIITLVSNPLTNLMAAYPNFMASVGCFERIQKFLLSEDRKDHRLFHVTSRSPSKSTTTVAIDSTSGPGIELHRLPLKPERFQDWAAEDDILTVEDGSFSIKDKEEPILHDINISFRRSSFTMIVGPVGSGKSILLKSLLGEIPSSKGFVRVNSGSAAYCDQTSWLVNDTVRQNILGESNFDQQWYATVLHACALNDDMAELPNGDESLVGSGGVTLSGGQKQRLALARAVYSRQQLAILDDVFSGLDNTTAKLIFSRLFDRQGLFRQTGTTAILATHAVHHLRSADKIIVLDKNGSVAQHGSFEDLQLQDGYVKSLSLEAATDSESLGKVESPADRAVPITQAKAPGPKASELDMKRKTGDIRVYKYYFRSIGLLYSLTFLLLAAAYIFLGKLPQIWLRIWTEIGTSYRPAMYFSLYVSFAIGCVLAAGLTVRFFMIFVIPKSSQHLHWLLLQSVMRAPFSFFSTTDIGITLNRFSQDMSLVDQALPMAAFTTIFDILNIIAETSLIASGAQYVAAIIPFCMIAVYFLQKFYLRTSRQLRYLDLEAKSPLFTHFTETLSGLATIRAFGWQDAFCEHNLRRLDFSQKPYYLLYCIQRWLNLVLDLFVAGIALVLVAFAVEMRSTTSSGAIGLAMINILGFNQSLSQLINSWTTLETSLGAIARLRNFVDETPSEDQEGESRTPPADWPSRGLVEIKDVTVSYQPESDPVLHNLSITVKAGQKIGICGRTGSGKSTLILTLFRLLDLRSGSLWIDGVNLSTIPRHKIRSKIIGLPQEPVKLSGSVRYNLDPLALVTDYTITTALEKVGLWDNIHERGGLNADMDTMTLSHGQQQLLCLASAMLRKSSILVLDEATSNVDAQTESVMQRLIRDEFKNHTIIAVAHRLDTIIDSDMIALFDKGRLVEFDTPGALMARNSAFKALYQDHKA